MIKRRRFAGALGAIVGLALACGPATLSAQALETKLKAAVVSKFPEFVEWPPAAFAGRATVDLCVVVPDPFGSDLQDLVAGETLRGRPMIVRRIDREQDLDACHLLVFPAGTVGPHRALLRRATSRPVLTVSDDQHFLDDGGIVRLRLVGGRMRFDINAGAARSVGLRISSQLLQLALTVRGSRIPDPSGGMLPPARTGVTARASPSAPHRVP